MFEIFHCASRKMTRVTFCSRLSRVSKFRFTACYLRFSIVLLETGAALLFLSRFITHNCPNVVTGDSLLTSGFVQLPRRQKQGTPISQTGCLCLCSGLRLHVASGLVLWCYPHAEPYANSSLDFVVQWMLGALATQVCEPHQARHTYT